MQRAEQDVTSSPSPFHVIDFARHTTERAKGLVRRHRLRGFDAIHLSTARELRDAAPYSASVELAATDARLVTAAEAESHPLMEW